MGRVIKPEIVTNWVNKVAFFVSKAQAEIVPSLGTITITDAVCAIDVPSVALAEIRALFSA